MSISKMKITQTEINTHNVKSAADVLTGNAADNKQVFDNLPEFIAERFNELCDELEETVGVIDASDTSHYVENEVLVFDEPEVTVETTDSEHVENETLVF